jgi:hypothetical protein
VILVAAVVAAAGLSCRSETVDGQPCQFSRVSVSPTTAVLFVGDSLVAHAHAVTDCPERFPDRFVWSLRVAGLVQLSVRDDTTVVVTAVSPGMTDVFATTASADSLRGNMFVEVKPK